MAVPAYTHDLTTLSNAESTTGWAEFTGNSYNGQGSPAGGDPDYPFIQGQYAVTQDCTKDATIGSLGYNAGAGQTIPTDGAALVWENFSSAGNIASYANGGFRVVIGAGLADFRAWYVGGVDKGTYPYGGWQCHAANPTVSPDDTAGTPGTTYQYFGAAVNVTTGPKKGEVHHVDSVRYGRCSSIFAAGDVSTPATIDGFVLRNDAQGNRWGLIQDTAGGYLWQGRMLLGETPAASAVYFDDSNKNIFVAFTPKVTRKFNLIEIKNSNSYISMDGFTFQVLDLDTNSQGWLKMTDPATLYLTSCNFIDMDRFIFNYLSNPVDITGTTFRRCGTVTQGGATFDACTFTNSTSAIALSADDLALITNTDFIARSTDGATGPSGHAIQIINSGTYVFDGNTFSNYASANGSTGYEAIYNTSQGLVTVNLQNTTSIPSYRNAGTSTTAVNLSVTLTLSGLVSGSEIRIQEARGTAPSGVELFHLETVPASANGIVDWTYNYSDFGAGYYIDVIVHNIYYTHLRIDNLLLPDTNSTLPIQQSLDRWYANP